MNIDKLYTPINKEEGERVCKGRCPSLSKGTPKLFPDHVQQYADLFGDTLSNPKTVLAWLMKFVNAPVYLISFMVLIR
ncbi:hypothetical protein ACNR9Q_05845 [Maribacter sp. X9]|uniref:hypothetical protein n=1 Tax=Maribacter sp. X9 TaxID=3402159 RepID=UPI003AF3F140